MFKLSVKKTISLVLILFSLILITGKFIKEVSTDSPIYDYTIVIDAGHGARDGGCVGISGSVEKDLNLQYALTLKSLLETKNIKVVMTRTNDDELYDENASNKKLSEMKARATLIKNSAPDLVISIHMNSFPLKSVSGAKAFYRADSEKSKLVADNIQKSMYSYCNLKSKTSQVGDYYILNCTDYTSVLIECGYLSNPEEEQKLLTKEYREKLMHSIYSGILLSFGMNHY